MLRSGTGQSRALPEIMFFKMKLARAIRKAKEE